MKFTLFSHSSIAVTSLYRSFKIHLFRLNYFNPININLFASWTHSRKRKRKYNLDIRSLFFYKPFILPKNSTPTTMKLIPIVSTTLLSPKWTWCRAITMHVSNTILWEFIYFIASKIIINLYKCVLCCVANISSYYLVLFAFS